MPKFEKRHLDYLAELLKSCRDHELSRLDGHVEVIDRVTDRFALMLEETNPRFKPELFRHATGRSTVS